MDASTLRAWRAAQSMSQGRAAAMLGVPLRTLQGLEQGRALSSPLWGPLARLMALLPPPAKDSETPPP